MRLKFDIGLGVQLDIGQSSMDLLLILDDACMFYGSTIFLLFTQFSHFFLFIQFIFVDLNICHHDFYF